MVEGASIDKSGHPNDITGVMSEMSGFDKAFQNAIDYAKIIKIQLSQLLTTQRWFIHS